MKKIVEKMASPATVGVRLSRSDLSKGLANQRASFEHQFLS